MIEIDRTSASLNKFSIYEGLGVPEIWRVAKGQVRIFLLTGEGYEEHDTSRAFRFLPAQVISEFLARGLAEGREKLPALSAPGCGNTSPEADDLLFGENRAQFVAADLIRLVAEVTDQLCALIFGQHVLHLFAPQGRYDQQRSLV